MSSKLVPPKFGDEAAEAQWWFDHQDDLLEKFESAEAEGCLGRGTLARRAATTVALDPEDIRLAAVLAERQGVDLRSYIRRVVHQALLTEEQHTDVPAA